MGRNKNEKGELSNDTIFITNGTRGFSHNKQTSTFYIFKNNSS